MLWPNPFSAISGNVMKRGVDDHDDMAKLPGWAVMVIFVDALVFLPLFFYIGYTLSHI